MKLGVFLSAERFLDFEYIVLVAVWLGCSHERHVGLSVR